MPSFTDYGYCSLGEISVLWNRWRWCRLGRGGGFVGKRVRNAKIFLGRGLAPPSRIACWTAGNEEKRRGTKRRGGERDDEQDRGKEVGTTHENGGWISENWRNADDPFGQ